MASEMKYTEGQLKMLANIRKLIANSKEKYAVKKVKENAAENANANAVANRNAYANAKEYAADAMMKRANAVAMAAAAEFRASNVARAASGLPPRNKTRGGRRQRRSRTRSTRRTSTMRKRK
jgi:hypothetical protein